MIKVSSRVAIIAAALLFAFSCASARHGMVESLQPTLEWPPFPRPIDLEKDSAGVLSGIEAISYDLKVWKEKKVAAGRPLYPAWGELVYSREGLPEPFHQLEEPLDPSARYVWSYRARFKLKDRTRVTDWGFINYQKQGFILRHLSTPRIRNGPEADDVDDEDAAEE